jgi:hypothetical protein
MTDEKLLAEVAIGLAPDLESILVFKVLIFEEFMIFPSILQIIGIN